MLCRNFNLYEDDTLMKKPTMKHIQFARDDINTLANRLNELVLRVTLLESQIGKKK